jgi:hypothetical protein
VIRPVKEIQSNGMSKEALCVFGNRSEQPHLLPITRLEHARAEGRVAVGREQDHCAILVGHAERQDF